MHTILAADCGPPPSISSGLVLLSGTDSGSKYVYICDVGYQLVGSNDPHICQSDGFWSGPTPVCQG